MSVATAISNIAATLRFLAATYTARADQMMEQAVEGVAGLPARKIGRVHFDVTRPAGPSVVRPTLSVPDPSALELPVPPTLETQTRVVTPFSAELPSLTSIPARALPQVTWHELPAWRPVLDKPTLTPPAPTLANPLPPTLSAPNRVTADLPNAGTPPLLEAPPDPPEFAARPLDLYRTGLAIAKAPLTGMTSWLAGIRGHSKAAEAALLAQLRAILTGDPVLPADWEQHNNGLRIMDIEAARRSGLEALDGSPGTQTGMPTGGRIAQKLEVELDALRALIALAAQSAQERQGHQIKQLIQAVETAGRMADRALELRSKEVGWVMEAWDAILDGAEAAGQILRQMADWEKQRQKWTTQYNQYQAKRLDALVKAEQAKLRRLQIEQGNDSAITAHNRTISEARQVAGQIIEQRIALFEHQIDWLGEDEKWRMQAWRGYSLDIERHQILLKRGAAERRLLQARLEHDGIRINAEELKVQRYVAQLASLSAESEQAAAQAQTLATQNRQKLDVVNVQLEAQAEVARSLNHVLKQSVAALLKTANADTATQSFLVQQQQLADRRALAAARLKLQEDHTTLLATIKDHERLIRQRLTRAKTQMQGAQVLGGIATQASSGQNAVGAIQAEMS